MYDNLLGISLWCPNSGVACASNKEDTEEDKHSNGWSMYFIIHKPNIHFRGRKVIVICSSFSEASFYAMCIWKMNGLSSVEYDLGYYFHERWNYTQCSTYQIYD